MRQTAQNLKPHFAAQAKERQIASGGDVRNKTVPVKVPEPKNADSRDQAGKAAGVKFDSLVKVSWLFQRTRSSNTSGAMLAGITCMVVRFTGGYVTE